MAFHIEQSLTRAQNQTKTAARQTPSTGAVNWQGSTVKVEAGFLLLTAVAELSAIENWVSTILHFELWMVLNISLFSLSSRLWTDLLSSFLVLYLISVDIIHKTRLWRFFFYMIFFLKLFLNQSCIWDLNLQPVSPVDHQSLLPTNLQSSLSLGLQLQISWLRNSLSAKS